VGKGKFNFGHLRSQKFAGFIFAAFLCFAAGWVMETEPTTSAVVMGIVGLYGLFVGGRTWTDQAALKFGSHPVDAPTPQQAPATVTKKAALTAPKKEEGDHEVD